MKIACLTFAILHPVFLITAGAQTTTTESRIKVDLSRYDPGPVTVVSADTTLTVRWSDDAETPWTAVFSLDAQKPLITAIRAGDKTVIDRARPVYSCSTGKRRGGWDAFFDFPPSHPEGTRSFLGQFHPGHATVESIGDRVEVSFDGMEMGIFGGTLRYQFFPGSRLVEQAAVLSTKEPDTAYFYDAGLEMTADQDTRPGGNMASTIAYYDPLAQFQTITPPYGSERHPLAVKYRAISAKSGAGSVAVFAPPHRYLFARDYTTNMGYVWDVSWRGHLSLGIRQLPDDNSPFYPWMNAPPGTEQRMSMFLMPGQETPHEVLDRVTLYTHGDRFAKLDGFQTFAPHWHLAYTIQAMAHKPGWPAPFKAVMENTGIDAAMIMDFHGDGHPGDLTDLRFRELRSYYEACRSQSDAKFLLIPAEEANTILGGHWALVFPKPVYWQMDRKDDQPLKASEPGFGTVWRVHNADDVWKMISDEGGYVYQTHPRTKGSTGYPDKIRDTSYFRDPRFLGAGWKAMPSDLSSPRLGERAFRTLDDSNNWGLHKRAIGEVDVFQIDPTHELYGHMNINYVRLPQLPSFDNYGQLLNAVARGDYFVSTGEVLLPQVQISETGTDALWVRADVRWTFPLYAAELVWGDGTETHRKMLPLTTTHQFGKQTFQWKEQAAGWKWARLAVWDVAGNGAFVNPVWKDKMEVK